MQVMKICQTLSIYHMPDLISLSSIMNLMETSFYNHATVVTVYGLSLLGRIGLLFNY